MSGRRVTYESAMADLGSMFQGIDTAVIAAVLEANGGCVFHKDSATVSTVHRVRQRAVWPSFMNERGASLRVRSFHMALLLAGMQLEPTIEQLLVMQADDAS